MSQYDLYYIEDRLKQWHPAVLRIDFEEQRKIHKVVMLDARGQEYTAMHVPLGELDARVIQRMMEINPERGYKAFDEIERNIQQREREQERKIEDMAYDMAETLRRPLIEDYFY